MEKDRSHLFTPRNLNPEDRGGYKVLPTMVQQIDFEEYAPKFKNLFHLTKDNLGILTAKWHSEDGPMVWNLTHHRAIWQLCKYVSQDESAECFILGGEGDKWLDGINLEADEMKYKGWLHFEHMYMDGPRINEGLINDVTVPTIGVINGPGFHTEMGLFCDVTLITDDAWIADMHYNINIVPGDGIQIALWHTMGVKRANYMMLTGQTLTAKQALDIGMVNEVLPREKIWDRAQELAELMIKSANRYTRRISVQVLRQPLKEMLQHYAWNSFGSEMFSTVISPVAEHDVSHWEAKVKMQKEGKAQTLSDSLDQDGMNKI